VASFAREAFAEGPIAIVYDDSFPGTDDKRAALEAIAGLVESLSTTLQVGVLPLLDDCNSMGARDLGLLPDGGDLGSPAIAALGTPGSRVRAAFVVGADPAAQLDRSSLMALQNLDLLVVSDLTLTDTARCADVVLPAASFAEKDGTFTNTERRVQRITQAVPSPGSRGPTGKSSSTSLSTSIGRLSSRVRRRSGTTFDRRPRVPRHFLR